MAGNDGRAKTRAGARERERVTIYGITSAQMRTIQRAIQLGRYRNVSHFVCVAARNQLEADASARA